MRDKVILGLLILFFGVNQCYADKQKQIVVSDTTIQVQEFDLGKKESDNNKLKKPQTITSTVTHARKLKRENKIDILQKKCESLGFQVDSLSHICDSLQTSNKDIQIKYDISIINQNSLKEESESKISKLEQQIKDQAIEYDKKVLKSALMEKLAHDEWLAIIIMQSPLRIGYDSLYNTKILHAIEQLEYKQYFPNDYKIFFPLLSNYRDYNKEIYQLINDIYITLKNRPNANITVLKNNFESGLTQSRFYNETAYNNTLPEEQRIVYLDRIIENVRLLFSKPTDCSATNFEKLLEKVK